jgi:hypothetical protein
MVGLVLVVLAVGLGRVLLAGGPGGAALAVGMALPTMLGLCGALCAMRAHGRHPERWRQGAAGEVATGAALASLPGRRWAVMHDLRVPGSRANIDHLVIGPTGVWVIDTKTTRARVTTRWGSVHLGDRKLDSRPLLWEAQMVGELLGVAARPLLAIHGDGLRRRGGRAGGVPALPAERIARRIRRGRRRLSRSEVEMLVDRAASSLPAYSRARTAHV